ncbi:hypothetical protein [Paenibacillus thermotolerans]|uniref:hypothetical protein n=1 Tax=Paenibacillus thermotolerans TaxID=3027807 RepID=UPI0023681A3D|nr:MULTISPECIES: hypothetical protein [unclassified Paenibacillus]
MKDENVYLKNFLKVRLVSDFEKAKAYYQDVLGFKVDGWDSYFYSNFDGVGQLYEEFKSKGAIIAYEPLLEQMGDSQWKHFAVKDLDGYVMVFGGGN